MDTSNLKIALLQAPLFWLQPEKNRNYFEKRINELQTQYDLIVLPEMFTTGFYVNPEEIAEEIGGATTQWMQKMSNTSNAAIIGSLTTRIDEGFFNSLLFVTPEGKVEYYSKRHLFRMGGEHLKYSNGNQQKIIEYRGWKICTLICYDLRFPVWSRNVNYEYDMLLYVANWPASRSRQWETLLKARAIENQCYTIAVNRIGTDGNNIAYSGNSMIINPIGEIIAEAKPEEEKNITIEINLNTLQNIRQHFPVLQDADKFAITF